MSQDPLSVSHQQREKRCLMENATPENVPNPSDADLCVEQLDRSIRIGVLCQLTQ